MLRKAQYIFASICLAIFLLQIVLFFGDYWSVGFTHEVWETFDRVGHHSNRGAMLSGRRGLDIFIESEQHPVPPDGNTWFPPEKSRWESAGSPPQFTVSGYTVEVEHTFAGVGYRYSVCPGPDWKGQYHLIMVSPPVILCFCGAIVAITVPSVVTSFRGRKRVRSGHCPQCGYDLRSGHDRCPECGTPVKSSEHR